MLKLLALLEINNHLCIADCFVKVVYNIIHMLYYLSCLSVLFHQRMSGA